MLFVNDMLAIGHSRFIIVVKNSDISAPLFPPLIIVITNFMYVCFKLLIFLHHLFYNMLYFHRLFCAIFFLFLSVYYIYCQVFSICKHRWLISSWICRFVLVEYLYEPLSYHIILLGVFFMSTWMLIQFYSAKT